MRASRSSSSRSRGAVRAAAIDGSVAIGSLRCSSVGPMSLQNLRCHAEAASTSPGKNSTRGLPIKELLLTSPAGDKAAVASRTPRKSHSTRSSRNAVGHAWCRNCVPWACCSACFTSCCRKSVPYQKGALHTMSTSASFVSAVPVVVALTAANAVKFAFAPSPPAWTRWPPALNTFSRSCINSAKISSEFSAAIGITETSKPSLKWPSKSCKTTERTPSASSDSSSALVPSSSSKSRNAPERSTRVAPPQTYCVFLPAAPSFTTLTLRFPKTL